ncbi:MAG: ABC transporter permease [Candidatus Micrarchaeales archaeon]|nr:ABC transporter permease [Candidatus Micrarchaeales archaeon]
MTLWSDTKALYKREMLVFRANLRTNIIRAIMFPLIIIVFFGNLGNVISNIPIAVVNYAGNIQSNQFINALQSGGSTLKVTTVTSQSTALGLLSQGQVDFVVVILPNFPSKSGGAGVDVYYSSSEFTVSEAGLAYIAKVAAEFGTSALSDSQPVLQQQSTVMSTPINGATGTYKDFLFSGVLPMVIIFSAIFGAGTTMISDRQLGNLKTYLVAPIKKNAIVLGKLLAGATTSIIYGSLAIVIGLLNGGTIAMGPLGLIWIMIFLVLVSIAFSALALILSARIKKFEVYAIASQMIALPVWFLSGGILPIQSLPNWLYPISLGNPVTYVNTALRDVMLSGSLPMGDLISAFAVMGIFMLVAVTLAMKLLKSTIE